jgi:hypothetical protein
MFKYAYPNIYVFGSHVTVSSVVAGSERQTEDVVMLWLWFGSICTHPFAFACWESPEMFRYHVYTNIYGQPMFTSTSSFRLNPNPPPNWLGKPRLFAAGWIGSLGLYGINPYNKVMPCYALVYERVYGIESTNENSNEEATCTAEMNTPSFIL